MAVIERYQQQNQPNATMLAPNARGIQAPASIGEGAMKLAKEVTDYAVSKDEANQKLWLINRQAADEIAAQQMLDDAQRNTPNGISVKDKLLSDWQTYTSTQTQGIDNPALQNSYSAILQGLGKSLELKAKVADDESLDRATTQNFTDGYNNKAKYYGLMNDPSALQEKLKKDVGELNKTLDETPMDPAKRDKLRKDMVENLTNGANMRWIELDPQGWKASHAIGFPNEQRMTDTSLPRGIRNNNPGNIKAGDSWQGATGQDDTGYAQFDTPENGLRAMAVNLKNQQKMHGISTVEDLVTKYAPPSENNTTAYINSVAQQLGVGVQDKINLQDPATLNKVMHAMIAHENGAQPYSDESINWAVNSALGNNPGEPPKGKNPMPSIGGVATANTPSSAWNLGTFEQQQNWKELADKTIKRNTEAAEKQKSIVEAQIASDMDIAANRGGLTYAQIEEAYLQQKISPAKRAELTKKLDEQNNLDAKSFAAMQRVKGAVNGTVVLDPKNGDDKKAVDAHYKATLQEMSATTQDPQDLQSKALSLVKSYGMVPASLQGQVRGQLRSSNPDDVAAGADMIAKLRQTNPQLLNDFAEEDIKAANHIDSLVQAGFTPQAAMVHATESLKMSPEIKAARSADFKEKIKSSSPDDAIKSALNSYWRADPSSIPPDMREQFVQLAEAEYIRTGNFDAAKKSATAMIGRSWGQTRIGLGIDDSTGVRWMKNAPEMYYAAPIAGVDNSKWMGEQLAHDMAAGDKMRPGGYDQNKMMLVTAPVKTKEGLPTYYVFYKDDNGVLQQYSGDNGALVWHPDWQTSQERERILRRARDAKAKENVGVPTIRAGF